MEVAMELEDDVFFADLSKQISLLIMDDDETPVTSCPSVSLQALSRTIHPTAQSPLFYEQTTCIRESKGTGVFIPRSSQPRRKNKQGRFTSFNSKPHRQQPEINTRGVSPISYNNNNNNNNNSFNPKKC